MCIHVFVQIQVLIGALADLPEASVDGGVEDSQPDVDIDKKFYDRLSADLNQLSLTVVRSTNKKLPLWNRSWANGYKALPLLSKVFNAV